jgi:hypothetical protein
MVINWLRFGPSVGELPSPGLSAIPSGCAHPLRLVVEHPVDEDRFGGRCGFSPVEDTRAALLVEDGDELLVTLLGVFLRWE